MELEIDRMLTLSMAHIEPDVIKELEKGELDSITVYDKATYGYIIYIHSKTNTGYKSLDDCINFSLKNDCKILCLDRDGNKVKELPIYKWE